jgi:phosphatidylserine decarboxylase
LQAMVSLSDNGAISMDATFGTNDVKFHLFTLMVFDAHHIRMPVAWIIISHQICDDLTEWLTPLKTKLLRKNLKWNLHVSSLMMLRKNYKHCDEFYFHSTFF